MRLWARAAVVLSLLLFVPYLLEQFDAPKAAAVRVLGLGAIAAALAAALPRGRRVEGRLVWQPLDVAVLVWLGVEGVATVASQAPHLSLFGDLEQHEGLLTSLGLAGVYASARLGTRDARDVDRTVRWMVAAAALSSVYALAQLVGLDRQPWQRAASYAEGRFMRPFATLGHANLLGVITAAALAVAVATAVQVRRRRAWWIAAVALLGVATIATLSRGAWLGGAVGAGLAGSLAWRVARPPSGRGGRAALLGAALGTVLLVVGVFASVPMLRTRFLELLSPATGTARTRLEIWRIALAMWRAHPGLGVGPDVFALLFQRYQTPLFWRLEWGTIHFHAHSIYLHVLATRGLAGAAAGAFGAAGLFFASRAAWRRAAESRTRLAPLLGALAALAMAGGFGALGTAGATLLAALLGSVAALAGVPTGPAATAREDLRAEGSIASTPDDPGSGKRRGGTPGKGRRSRSGPRPRLATNLWWPGLVVAAATLVPQTNELRGLAAAHDARVSMPRVPAEVMDARCARSADRAASLLPANDQIAKLRANVYLAYVAAAQEPPGASLPPGTLEAWLAEAERSARRAIALVPQRAGSHQTLGNVLLARARRGDREGLAAALAAYRRSWDWAPYSAFTLDQFAYQAVDLGRPDLALAPARRAASLYPDQALTQGVLGEVALALGDTTAAVEAFTRALAGSWGETPLSREEIERSLEELRTSRRAPDVHPPDAAGGVVR